MQAGGASSPFTRPARLSQRTGTFRNVSGLQRCGQESVPHRQGSEGAVSQPSFWNRALREEGEEEWKARLQPDQGGQVEKGPAKCWKCQWSPVCGRDMIKAVL